MSLKQVDEENKREQLAAPRSTGKWMLNMRTEKQ